MKSCLTELHYWSRLRLRLVNAFAVRSGGSYRGLARKFGRPGGRSRQEFRPHASGRTRWSASHSPRRVPFLGRVRSHQSATKSQVRSMAASCAACSAGPASSEQCPDQAGNHWYCSRACVVRVWRNHMSAASPPAAALQRQPQPQFQQHHHRPTGRTERQLERVQVTLSAPRVTPRATGFAPTPNSRSPAPAPTAAAALTATKRSFSAMMCFGRGCSSTSP